MAKSGKWRARRLLTASACALPSRIWTLRFFPGPPSDPGPVGRSFWICLVSLAVLAGAVLLPNRSFPLFEPDEGRRAEIGREILANGHWAVCTLHNQPYYDKPPLFHWLVAISFSCFGVDESAARLPSALAAVLTVLATFVAGR